jgi:uncharacterized protein
MCNLRLLYKGIGGIIMDNKCIKKFITGDENIILDTLKDDPYYNILMIGNIETFGMENRDLEYWGYYDNDDLKAILMRYKFNWGVYQKEEIDYYDFGDIITKYNHNNPKTLRYINGHWQYVMHLYNKVEAYRPSSITHKIFYRLEDDSELIPNNSIVRRATEEDIDKLVEFYSHAGEMRRDRETIEGSIKSLRIYISVIGDSIVSSVATNTESSNMAMIGGLFTPRHLRGHGYGRACVSEMCRQLIKEGKTPCLFNDDPLAEKIVKSLGFKAIGNWKMIKYEE